MLYPDKAFPRSHELLNKSPSDRGGTPSFFEFLFREAPETPQTIKGSCLSLKKNIYAFKCFVRMYMCHMCV